MQYFFVMALLFFSLFGLNSSSFAAGGAGEDTDTVPCNPKDTYALELMYEPSAQANGEALGELAIWSMQVDSLLKEAGYSILDTHHYHNPTVLDLPCPAPKHAHEILQLIEDNDLAPPSSYQFRKHNQGLSLSINLLLSIECQDSGIIFSGGIPAKSLTDALLEEPLSYKMSIKDPAGNRYCSKFTQHAAKPVEQSYPQDFAPEAGSLTPGDYHLTISIDNQVVRDFQFILTDTFSID